MCDLCQGVVAVGSDADLVVWDGEASRVISARTHQQRCDFSVFEGQRVRGVAEWVVSRGRVCVEEGQLRAVQAAGRFLSTPAFPPELYLRVRQRDKTRLPRPVDRSGAADAPDATTDAAEAADVSDGGPVTPSVAPPADTASSVTETGGGGQSQPQSPPADDDRGRQEPNSPGAGEVV